MASPIDPTAGSSQTPGLKPQQPLTPQQKQALAKLHDAATQFEGVFIEMLMNAMQETVPQQTLFGGDNSAEQTWQSMLNDERSQEMAKSGSFGLAQQLESEFRSQVLGDASHEANVDVDRRIEP
ncbi:MAG TPA: rod-binding protein [Alphaproteobacteria bacterium]|nr:rod-binding protein [Alphaproteobacteria bacterium]